MKNKYHHGNLRDTLIEEGFKLTKKEGLHSLTLRRVAMSAGVSHSAPYRHFKDKQALIVAIATKGYELFNQILSEAIDSQITYPAKLESMKMAYVNFAIDNEDYYRLLFGKSLPKDEYPEKLLNESLKSFNMLKALLEKSFAVENAEQQALQTWAQLHGLITLYLDGKMPPQYLSIPLETIVEGLQPPQA